MNKYAFSLKQSRSIVAQIMAGLLGKCLTICKQFENVQKLVRTERGSWRLASTYRFQAFIRALTNANRAFCE